MTTTTAAAPNIHIHCNLCGAKIGEHCLLSPNWSLQFSFESSIPKLREHMEKEHGIKPPAEQSNDQNKSLNK